MTLAENRGEGRNQQVWQFRHSVFQGPDQYLGKTNLFVSEDEEHSLS